LLSEALQKGHLPPATVPAYPSFTAVAIIALALLTAAAPFSHVRDRQICRRKDGGREIPRSEEVSRASLALGAGMFAKQFAPCLPNFPFSPTEAKFISESIDFRVFKGMDAQPPRKSFPSSEIRISTPQLQRKRPQRYNRQQTRPLA
jgi:hypothetical protein